LCPSAHSIGTAPPCLYYVVTSRVQTPLHSEHRQWSVDTTLSFWAVAPRDTRVVRLARHALARFAESGEACCHPGEAGIRRSVLPAAAGKCERVPPNHYGRQLRQTQNCERAAAGSEWPTAGSAIAHPGSQFPVRAAYPAAAIISTMLYLTYRMGAT
jgi:hypothetical protein